MRVPDAIAGLVTAALGVAAIAISWRFPAIPGQPIGPAAFPTLVGTALMVSGITLFISGRLRGASAPVEAGETAGGRKARLPFLAVVLGLGLYAVVVAPLGFHLASALLLGALLLSFGVRRGRALAVAAVVPLLLHYVFYSLLRVPLPWGVLRGVAW